MIYQEVELSVVKMKRVTSICNSNEIIVGLSDTMDKLQS